MPFLRYERLPLHDADMSDETSSNQSTPQHIARMQGSTTNAVLKEAEGRHLLNDSQRSEAAIQQVDGASQMRTNVQDIDSAGSGHVPSLLGYNNAGGASAIAIRSGLSAEEEYAPPTVDMNAPPPYSECDDDQSVMTDVVLTMPEHYTTQQQAALLPALPAGRDEVEPPSYEEVQRIKAVEAQLETDDNILLPPHSGGLSGCEESDSDRRANQQDLLGTDLLFFIAFAAAFFFSWVGFVVMVCFCNSVAGRTGALAGVGLSLSKWALVVKHTVETKEANAWLLWLIMVLGLVVCLRAVLQYLNAKREWQNASAASRHRFLLFN